MALIIAADKDGNETRISEEYLEQYPESGLQKVADIIDDVIVPVKKSAPKSDK